MRTETAEAVAPRRVDERVAEAVRTVRARFRWYDELIAASPYHRSGDLRDLPLVDEQVLAAHYYGREHHELRDASAYHTSGTSSGLRKRILYSPRDHARYVEQRTRVLERFVGREARCGCADLGTGHAADSAAEIFRNLGLEVVQIDFRRPLDEHLRILDERRPDVLFTMPVILDRLLTDPGRRWSPRKVIVVGDVASPAWKQGIRRQLGLERGDLLDVVGSIEVGSVAWECFECGCYHVDDALFPEGIPTGTSRRDQKLIVTSSIREYFPAVRYVTGDLVRNLREISCGGARVHVFDCMLGRVGSDLKHGEKISMFEVAEAVCAVIPNGLFEVAEGAGLSIRLRASDWSAQRARRIVDLLRGGNPEVDQMIRSGLVGDIQVVAAETDAVAPGSKRRSR